MRLKMVYQRYLVRETLAAVLLVLLAFIALFSFFDFVDEMRRVGQENYSAGYAFVVVLLSLPGLVYELIPVAALIGTLYALATLARHSEITVLRASGLATGQLLMTLYRVAAMLAIATFVLGEVLVPVSDRLAQEVKAEAMNKSFAQQGFLSGIWVKDGRDFINIRNAVSDSYLEGVRIYSFDSANALRSVTEAASASFAAPQGWLMRDVQRTNLLGEEARVTHLDGDVWQSSITPDLLSALMVSPERMSLYDLFGYTKHLSDNRQNTERYEIAIWKKILYPMASLVMVTLALPFGYSHDRVGGVSLKIFAGVMLGIAFYALNGLFSNLGVINAWPPLASAAAPSALFLLAAGVMIWWVERR
ncbi:LPS export ABC transporter permease LptG [Azonexus sp.]|uniref:LPS export ABC transporter permease LptG n=1 Tax=Azonexus sp. TaxID=1872668 RepID=UPI0027BA9797|nr:LPS export ABC transporter permease LptG [Azonexus sp.]